MCRNLVPNRPATLWKKESGTVVFSYEFLKIFKNDFFTEHHRTTVSEYRNNMSRAFKTKYEKNESNDIFITYLQVLMASTYTWLSCNISMYE